MKKVFSILLLVAGFGYAEEQDSVHHWILSVDANLTVNQSAYSKSWAGEEVGTLAWTAGSNALAERQATQYVHTKNTLKLYFGQTRFQSSGSRHWSRPDKSNDLIDLESVLRLTFGWAVDPFGALRMVSQFLDKREPEKTRFVNPMTFSQSVGVARALIKRDTRELITRLGGGFRQYVNRLSTGTKVRSDGGLTLVAEFKSPFAEKRIYLTSRFNIYQALFYSEADVVAGTVAESWWTYPDVDWETIFTANITNYLLVNLYGQLLFDREIAGDLRLKQTLALGLTFKFI